MTQDNDTEAPIAMVEMVLRVRFPRHPSWDDETAERVRGFVVEGIRDRVRNFYGTRDWAESSVEELGRPWRSTPRIDEADDAR
jgi:hypothetical protein